MPQATISSQESNMSPDLLKKITSISNICNGAYRKLHFQ